MQEEMCVKNTRPVKTEAEGITHRIQPQGTPDPRAGALVGVGGAFWGSACPDQGDASVVGANTRSFLVKWNTSPLFPIYLLLFH